MATLKISNVTTSSFFWNVSGLSPVGSQTKLVLTTTNYGSSYTGAMYGFIYEPLAVSAVGMSNTYVSGTGYENANLIFDEGDVFTVYAYRYTDKWYICGSGQQVIIPYNKPSTPSSGVSASRITGGFNLSWGSSTNATSYELYYTWHGGAYSNTITGISGTSYSLTGLLYGTTYNFQVRARNSYGVSSYTTANPATTMPKIPTVSKGTVSSNSITINITGMEGNYTGVRVYIYNNSGTQLNYDNATSVATFTGLTPNTTYQFDARAYFNVTSSDTTWSNYSNRITVTTPSSVPLTPSSAVIASYNGTTGFNLSWGESTYATSYSLFYYYLVGSDATGGNTVNTSNTYCTVTGLTYGRTYYFTVQGVNSTGASAWTTHNPATIKPYTPTITNNDPTNTTVRINKGYMTGLWDTITVYQYESNGTTLKSTVLLPMVG